MKGYALAIAVMLTVNAGFAGESLVSKEQSKVEGIKDSASELVWLTDFEQAKKQAEAEGKYILLDFSGSDWCGWCIRLDEEVFSKAGFRKYAQENLVLVLLDFPQKKPQSDKLKAQNESLAKRYGVEGFPTVLILDSKAKSVAKTGYQAGGPDVYVKHLKELIANSKANN